MLLEAQSTQSLISSVVESVFNHSDAQDDVIVVSTFESPLRAVFCPYWFPIEPVSSPNSCHRLLKHDGLCHSVQCCADCNVALHVKQPINNDECVRVFSRHTEG